MRNTVITTALLAALAMAVPAMAGEMSDGGMMDKDGAMKGDAMMMQKDGSMKDHGMMKKDDGMMHRDGAMKGDAMKHDGMK